MGTVEQYGIRSNPDIVLDHDAAFARLEFLLADGSILPRIFMIGRRKSTIGCDADAFSDTDTVAAIEDTTRIDDTVGTNMNITRAARLLDLDEGVNDDILANLDRRPLTEGSVSA